MSETSSLEVSRTVKAPIDRVWQAWTDPAQMRQWYAPQGLTTPVAEVDLRVGGAYRIGMHKEGEDQPYIAMGVFKEVQAPRRLVFTWKWEGSPEPETVVTVELSEVEEGATNVVLRHEGFAAAESRDNHKDGWTSSLEKLADYVQ